MLLVTGWIFSQYIYIYIYNFNDEFKVKKIIIYWAKNRFFFFLETAKNIFKFSYIYESYALSLNVEDKFKKRNSLNLLSHFLCSLKKEPRSSIEGKLKKKIGKETEGHLHDRETHQISNPHLF